MKWRRSAIGPKRTSFVALHMSAFGGKADMCHPFTIARGVHKPDSDLVTSRMLGCCRDNPLTRQGFLSMAV